MASAIAYLQMGQSLAQDMSCPNLQDPTSCVLFSGKYLTCAMYAFVAGQPGSWNNNGADCMINHSAFTQANIPTGYAASDKQLYSQATSGTNNVLGSTNYGLSSDNASAINNSVKLQQGGAVVNRDENINYNPNFSRSTNLAISNGLVNSVTIDKSAVQNLGGITSFQTYLSDDSVNLAWNRQKAEPDPSNIKNITFNLEGISRAIAGNAFKWNDTPNQPIINGLCVHFADYCQGGDDDATGNNLIKAELAWAGGFTNPNFCAKCTVRDPIFGECLGGEPRQVLQQWCCFNSKVALDINLAAYDQGLLNIYTKGNRYTDQINHANGICAGVTVGMISQIDFSKGNYFSDLMSSLDVNQIIDTSNFTNGGIQGNTQSRNKANAMDMVKQWQGSRP